MGRKRYEEVRLHGLRLRTRGRQRAGEVPGLQGAEHEVLTASTKKNFEMRVDAENGATKGKFDMAKKAKGLNFDAIHDTVHEMACDEVPRQGV